jgi:hypothetical protein
VVPLIVVDEYVATPLLTVPVPIVALSSKKLTLPVGATPLVNVYPIVAVSVVVVPPTGGFGLTVSASVVAEAGLVVLVVEAVTVL